MLTYLDGGGLLPSPSDPRWNEGEGKESSHGCTKARGIWNNSKKLRAAMVSSPHGRAGGIAAAPLWASWWETQGR